MTALLLGSLIAIIGILCYTLARGLGQNIAIAKASGIRYVITPLYIMSVPWLLLQPVLVPLLEYFPEIWTENWLPFIVFGNGWNNGYKPFEVVGADTFIAVSPTKNVIHTCDAEVSAQIFRRNEIGKPVELIDLLNVFGPGLTGSEGRNGRLYRKITAPYFNEQIMDKVWVTSLESCKELLEDLMELQASGSGMNLRSKIANITLYNVISVCFEDERKQGLRITEASSPGHTRSLRQTVLSVLDHMVIIALIPKVFQRCLPLRAYRNAFELLSDMGFYLEDLRSRAVSSNKFGKAASQENLLDLLIQGKLPSKAIEGNVFSFMFAGHEANANTLTFAIFLLACYPDIQLSLQEDITKIVGSKPLSELNYRTCFPLLKDSLVGAVINETLRLFTILPFIPKRTPHVPVTIVIKGKQYTLPGNTLILINTSAAHRHPAHWPAAQGPLGGSKPHPVASFNPGYWIKRDRKCDEGVFLRPQQGSFVPFSDGGRGCLGRQFALVELCAQLTRIFNEYSVELVAEATEDRVGKATRKEGWREARRRAEDTMSRGVVFDLTLRPKEMVPIRFTKRNNADMGPLLSKL